MSESTPRREATRRALVEAAIREFGAKGIDATSVEQLCESAGFTRGAFYSNFATKDDLCMAVLEYHRDRVLDGLERTYAEPPADADLEWASRTAVQHLFQLIAPTEAFRLTLIEIQLRSLRQPELAKRATQLAAEVRPGMRRFVEQVADQFGLEFRISTDDLLDVFEAVFFFQQRKLDVPDEPRNLIGPVAVALSYPKEQHG